jgi:ketosteroid isomerase-like protein
MDALGAAQRWRDTWLRAWREQDVDAIRALYADDAVFRSHPFRNPHAGAEGVADYVRWAFADEELPADVWFGEPWVADDRATCEWWAAVRYEGRDVTLAGVAVLRFGEDGLVATQRDYWAQEDGRREPPEDWGS